MIASSAVSGENLANQKNMFRPRLCVSMVLLLRSLERANSPDGIQEQVFASTLREVAFECRERLEALDRSVRHGKRPGMMRALVRTRRGDAVFEEQI